MSSSCVVPDDTTPCISTSDGGSSCPLGCSSNQSCPGDTPVCDSAVNSCRVCAEGEDYLCKERNAATPRCVGGLCVACVAPRGVPGEAAECETGATFSATPICDQNVCRACQRHSECMSGVCAKDNSGAAIGVRQGSCVPVEQVLVVDQDLCSGSGPVFCTPAQAFAQLGPMRRFVLLRKSALPSDFSGLSLGNLLPQTTQPIYVIGPLADHPPEQSPGLPPATLGGVAASDGLTVVHGHIVLEGLFVAGNHIGISCTGSDANVQIVRSMFSGNDTAISASGGCQLNVSETWIGSGPISSGFQGLPGNTRGIDITGADFQVVNTVFVDNGNNLDDAVGGIRVHSVSAGTNTSLVINTTFYEEAGLIKGDQYITTFLCDSPVGNRLIVLNSLFFGDEPLLTSPEEHYIDPACGISLYHVGSNDATLTANDSAVISDMPPALFVDAPGRDLRPWSGNDMGRAAVALDGVRAITINGQTLDAPLVDLDEQTRGQSPLQTGNQVALGAFEPVLSSSMP